MAIKELTLPQRLILSEILKKILKPQPPKVSYPRKRPSQKMGRLLGRTGLSKLCKGTATRKIPNPPRSSTQTRATSTSKSTLY